MTKQRTAKWLCIVNAVFQIAQKPGGQNYVLGGRSLQSPPRTRPCTQSPSADPVNSTRKRTSSVHRTPGKTRPDVLERPDFLEFVIKTIYVLDTWKTCCWPWLFSGVLESSWTVVKLFIIELLITSNIHKARLNNVIERNDVRVDLFHLKQLCSEK